MGDSKKTYLVIEVGGDARTDLVGSHATIDTHGALLRGVIVMAGINDLRTDMEDRVAGLERDMREFRDAVKKINGDNDKRIGHAHNRIHDLSKWLDRLTDELRNACESVAKLIEDQGKQQAHHRELSEIADVTAGIDERVSALIRNFDESIQKMKAESDERYKGIVHAWRQMSKRIDIIENVPAKP